MTGQTIDVCSILVGAVIGALPALGLWWSTR